MGAERRLDTRWQIESIEIAHLTSLDQLQLIATHGYLVDASTTGFLIHVDREDLVPRKFRGNLTLDPLVGDQVSLEITQMNLDIVGKIVRTRNLGRGRFEIGVDYTDDAPEYWRECLLDLLPKK